MKELLLSVRSTIKYVGYCLIAIALYFILGWHEKDRREEKIIADLMDSIGQEFMASRFAEISSCIPTELLAQIDREAYPDTNGGIIQRINETAIKKNLFDRLERDCQQDSTLDINKLGNLSLNILDGRCAGYIKTNFEDRRSKAMKEMDTELFTDLTLSFGFIESGTELPKEFILFFFLAAGCFLSCQQLSNIKDLVAKYQGGGSGSTRLRTELNKGHSKLATWIVLSPVAFALIFLVTMIDINFWFGRLLTASTFNSTMTIPLIWVIVSVVYFHFLVQLTKITFRFSRLHRKRKNPVGDQG